MFNNNTIVQVHKTDLLPMVVNVPLQSDLKIEFAGAESKALGNKGGRLASAPLERCVLYL